MAVVIEVQCEKHEHRLEFRNDGTIHMLDHDERVVRGFVAFGAKPPACLEAINEAEENPVRFLLEKIEVDDKTRVLLACDFAEHVLPIWEEYYPYDHRLKKAIEAARKYVSGKIKKPALDKAEAAARSAAAEASWAARAAWSAASASVRSAGLAATAWSASASASAAEASSAAEGASAWDAAQAARSAARAAYYYAKKHGDDPEEAKAAEKKWQSARMVQVLEAISRGEDPWAS